MASDKNYLSFVLETSDRLSARPMMGEYVVYFRGKVIGGVYDNRFLIKPTPSVQRLMPDAEYVFPYQGAKQMVVLENMEDKDFCQNLFEAMYTDLPFPKSKK